MCPLIISIKIGIFLSSHSPFSKFKNHSQIYIAKTKNNFIEYGKIIVAIFIQIRKKMAECSYMKRLIRFINLKMYFVSSSHAIASIFWTSNRSKQ